jgi:hypothetical protein
LPRARDIEGFKPAQIEDDFFPRSKSDDDFFLALRKKSSTVVARPNPSFRITRAADVVGVTAKTVCPASLNPRCTSLSVVVFPAPATPQKLNTRSLVSRMEVTACF